ncbi:class I SAM-dependent methyltransferase [Plebeiibacterium sediminum]|uniref:Class I SAM-dependent methyltransferase n=1 Tax=Plebeiibacterium sediminum TaxID=2992112 RepID=A0AAE3SFN3_9BACT|nr:class I SAM-dependent methyltransferase [Plebeiobacterium sediminum]MCW3787441.1 class I SAM-dependent methyltransferase [Plebeiobacterium sediminum]
MDKRIENEIEHGKFLSENNAGEIWNWESPAGKVRWKRRVKMLTKHINANEKVLELGCGTGYFTQEIIQTKAQVVAIDISPDLLSIARKNITDSNVSFCEENAYKMTFDNDYFDSVIGSSVLHHLDIDKAIAEIHRVLKVGGVVAFTEPNMMNPQIALQKNIPWLKRKLGDSPDETAFFRWQIVRLLKKYNFREIKVIPFDFLHPAIPLKLVKTFSSIGNFCEKTPLVNEIAGSLYITAIK